MKYLGYLLSLANASHFLHKRPFFYKLKDRILEDEHLARPDFCDLQHFEEKCWCRQGDRCLRCWGTGIRSARDVLLQRYLVDGYLFHAPRGETWNYGKSFTLKNRISGYVRHKKIHPFVGIAAFFALSLVLGDWRWFRPWVRCCLRYYVNRYFWRLQYRYLAFKRKHIHDDDIPF